MVLLFNKLITSKLERFFLEKKRIEGNFVKGN